MIETIPEAEHIRQPEQMGASWLDSKPAIHFICSSANHRAFSLLMWSGGVGGVPFSLRENGHECCGSLYTYREIALAERAQISGECVR